MSSTDAEEIRRQQVALFRFVNRRVRDRALSEDILQEAFIRFLKVRGTTNIADSGAWLRTVALNLVRDHFRSSRERGREYLTDRIEDQARLPDEAAIFQERVQFFRIALDQLPPIGREVIIRRKLEGESAREVARALNLSEAAVDQHVARALMALNRMVGKMSRAKGRRR